jgi:Arc/MetJ family transcription regulator
LHGRAADVYKFTNRYTKVPHMRTNIEIDDKLMKQALRLTGYKTKRAVVEAGLQMLVRVKGQEEMLKLAGKVHWDGNLDEMRRDLDDPR